MAPKEYILIDRAKIEDMEMEAYAKVYRNADRPLSEASIEAKAVLSVINYLYNNNVWINPDKLDEQLKDKIDY